MSSETAVRVENLNKCYHIYQKPRDRLLQMLWGRRRRFFQEFWALRDVSFEVHKGETVGIIGRNGSGKSTLLQLICGTLNPTSGSIRTQGRIAALLELGSGFNPEFTGRENVYLNATVLGLTKEEIDARYDDIVAFADIGDFIIQPVKTYSSGMVIRLAFAVIAHVDADILVVDEALAVGDAFFVQKCMRFLRKFIETGTLIFVSHDSAAVVNLCSRAIWLHEGIIHADGAPKEISEAYLASQYEAQQGASCVAPVAALEPADEAARESNTYRDMRLDFINTTPYRNDVELFQFQSDGMCFGKGSARIVSVRLLDMHGQPLSWIVGGEKVKLEIVCDVFSEITNPIVGFYIKDRLGQPLFGDNTFNFIQQAPLRILSHQRLVAAFEFTMPILPMGDYSITAAIAEGTQENHVQHHWIHDALLLKSHSSSVCTGLVGIPMANIRIFTV